jgi:hypothetical protein
MAQTSSSVRPPLLGRDLRLRSAVFGRRRHNLVGNHIREQVFGGRAGSGEGEIGVLDRPPSRRAG